MDTKQQILDQLNSKIPRDVISKRDAGNGRKLDYLEGWYVINRLNEIFGQGNWSYTTVEMKLVFEGEVNGKFSTSYISNVKLTATFPNSIGGETVSFTDYGYGDGTDNRNPGKAHELAVKEAVTDGIKRCAKSLGTSMGLALYDKSQENVDEGTEVKSKARKGNPSGASTDAPKSVPNADATPVGATTEAGGLAGRIGSSKTKWETRADLNMLIGSSSRVVISRKLMSKEEILDYMESKYTVKKKEELTDEQAAEFFAFLESKYTEAA